MKTTMLLLASTLLAGPALAQSAGGNDAKPNAAPKAESLSPSRKPVLFQPLGTFPTNQVTNRPYVGPQGGEEGLRKTVGALQTTLTELQQLQLQVKEAHWNVSGPEFYQIHEMLQEHYEGLSKDADMVAERLLSIGVSADGRATTIVKTSSIPEIPGGFLDGAQEVAYFTDTYQLVGDEIRQGIHDTEKFDPTTSNLLQTVEDNIDKYQWQTRAFLQTTPTNPNDGSQFSGGKPVDTPNNATPNLNQPK